MSFAPGLVGEDSEKCKFDGPKRIANQDAVAGSCWARVNAARRRPASSFSFPALASNLTSSATLTRCHFDSADGFALTSRGFLNNA